jgi:hypothetical protein
MRFTRRKLMLGSVIVVGIAALGLWFSISRATRLINGLLRDFASAETTRLSDSTYILNVGALSFDWPQRKVTLDSVLLTTDTARNARRAEPLAATRAVLRNCTLFGIQVTTLVLGRGLVAGGFGCSDVLFATDKPAGLEPAADSALPAARPATPAASPAAPAASPAAPQTTGPAAPGAFLALQQGLALPSQVPALRLSRITFPNVAISLVQRYERGDRLEFVLERAQLRITGLAIDPADSAAALRTLFSESVVLSAENAAFRPDTSTSVSLGRLDINLNDSNVIIRDFAFGPLISDEAYARQSPWRRERIRASARKLAFKGLDINLFARSGALRVRALELDSLMFEIRGDKRKPPRPGPKPPKRSIQGFMAARPRSLQIDTIRITNSQVAYEEFAKNRDTPGRLVFARLNAVGTSFLHQRGVTTRAHPFLLEATTFLMGRGRLRVAFEVPLDAPTFAMRTVGSLGPTPASALNPFISQILPAAVKGGQLNSVTFVFRVENGRARGTLTPLYTGLAVDVTGRGMTGVLGNRGIIGGIVRGAAELAAGFKVRGNNPDKPDRPPKVGTINHTFHGESLPSFFWNAIKTGLLPVVVK